MNAADDAKRLAAERALALVEDGMALGLGTGSTAAHFVAGLGRRVAQGLTVVGVPTSEATRRQAEALAIPLATLDDRPDLDLTIDGADEIDPQLRAIKGGGGALLREKMVAAASRRMVVIADASKRVERLGAFPLPIEIVRFGREATRRRLAAVLEREGFAPDLRLRLAGDQKPFVTDEAHFILDAHLVSIPDPERLASALAAMPGVVEHGLFIGLVTAAIIGANTGPIEIGPFPSA